MKIKAEDASAMKADLMISWNKLRTMRRYMYTCTCNTGTHMYYMLYTCEKGLGDSVGK